MPKRTLTAEEELTQPLRGSNDMTEWTRSETLALAQQSCTLCYGLGLRAGRGGASTPCNCVFRAIFRACYERFRYCASREKHISRVSLETNQGKQRNTTYGLKDEEFVADFCLVSRRALTPAEHKIFRAHFLLGADFRLCCPKFNLDRGTFFHEIYRIEHKLGKVFRELRPHPLFPVDEYFNGTSRYEKMPVAEILPFPVVDEGEGAPAPKKRIRKMLKFPIRYAA